jgi:long-chain acyl-CoA synthetase
LADHKGIKGSHEEFCANKEIKKLILTQLNDIGRKGGLNGFELAKNIFLEPTSFLSQKLLTNTLKIIRFEARNHYKSEINKLYEEG